MRKEFWLLLLVNGSIILFLTYQVSDLISLLNDDSGHDAFKEHELTPVTYKEVTTVASNGSEIVTLEPDRPLLIPKIIHQTYKTSTIPDKWLKTHQSVMDLHPNYEYILWTDQMARDFIEEHYDWFLPTFDSYPYNIMRADVIRYFVLSHYGGVYLDLDNGCTHNMDPLLAAPAWLRKTNPTGVSNDLMGSVPKHPYFQKVIDNLERYNHNWFVSYITIMYSTGPLFLSVLWKQYKRWGVPKGEEVRILVPLGKSNHTSYFFYQGQGSSWHQDDAKFIFQMGRHWFLMTILITAIVFLFFYLQYKLYQKISFTTINKYRRLAVRHAGRMIHGSGSASGSRRRSRRHQYGRTRSRSNSPMLPLGGNGRQSPGSDRSWGSSRSTSPELYGSDSVMLTDHKDWAIRVNETPVDEMDKLNESEGQLLARPKSRNEDLV